MTRSTDSENNRQRLLEEGIRLFSEHGYHGIGLKDILGAVNIPKGSFYHYFDSKEDYGAKVVDYYTELTRDKLALLLQKERDAYDSVEQFFVTMLKMHEDDGYQHGCLAGSMGAEISNTSEVCRLAVTHSLVAIRKALQQAIKRGQDRGSVSSTTEAGDLADLLLNSFEGAVLRMKIEKSPKPMKQFINILLPRLLEKPK